MSRLGNACVLNILKNVSQSSFLVVISFSIALGILIQKIGLLQNKERGIPER
jgi:hypothetical protein